MFSSFQSEDNRVSKAGLRKSHNSRIFIWISPQSFDSPQLTFIPCCLSPSQMVTFLLRSTCSIGIMEGCPISVPFATALSPLPAPTPLPLTVLVVFPLPILKLVKQEPPSPKLRPAHKR